MALTEFWVSSRQQLEDKHIQQIIAFAGDGKLRDGSIASEEFREFLLHIPADLLNQYIDQCLQGTFTEGGLALQDDDMNITEKENRYYWHVHISYIGNEYVLHLKGGVETVNLTRFVLL